MSEAKMVSMLRSYAVRAALVAVVAMCSACASSGGNQFVGKPAPATRFSMLSGEYLPIEAFRGKTTVLIFWAQWCTASSPVMKRLNELSQRVKNSGSVIFLAVSVDKSEDETKVRERITYQQLGGFQHAYSGNEVYDEAYMAFEGRELPYVIIVDPAGKVVRAGNSDGFVVEYLRERGLLR